MTVHGSRSCGCSKSGESGTAITAILLLSCHSLPSQRACWVGHFFLDCVYSCDFLIMVLIMWSADCSASLEPRFALWGRPMLVSVFAESAGRTLLRRYCCCCHRVESSLACCRHVVASSLRPVDSTSSTHMRHTKHKEPPVSPVPHLKTPRRPFLEVSHARMIRSTHGLPKSPRQQKGPNCERTADQTFLSSRMRDGQTPSKPLRINTRRGVERH